MNTVERADKDSEQVPAEGEAAPPAELFDPWSSRLAFEKSYRLPTIPDLSEDLSGTIH
jgi:hypothetical protein